MPDLATNPTMPNASPKKRTNVPNFPAFDSQAKWPMMKSMYSMNAAMPMVKPKDAICSSVNLKIMGAFCHAVP